jgi:PQQ-dependent dehydrogenase (methanol/ethanol family)
VRFAPSLLLLLLCSSALCAQGLPAPPASAAPSEDGQWVMPAKNFANTRYSGLDEINSANVSALQLAFTFNTGTRRGQEGSPLVVNNTMYVLTPYPNILYALDLTKAGAAVKWKYEPKQEPAAQGVACCDTVNRGPTFAGGRIYFNTLDASAVAVDAETGREVWKTKLGSTNAGETMTMAPLVTKDKVFVGNSGGEFGVRGFIAALDAHTGQELWRAYSTGPDAEVLVGANFKPFYAKDQGKDLGVSTWPPQAWQQGGGTVWGWLSYDPDLNLVYHGTGNPAPWNSEQRPGDNKWTAGIFARDPDSGEARWFYQVSPHDLYAWDAVNENVLLDLEFRGQPRKALIRPERNGYVYMLDRSSGEVLYAAPYHPNTATKGVDLKAGELIYIAAKRPEVGKVVRDICPAAAGAKNWQPSAYSVRTGLLYIPHNNLCMDLEIEPANYIAGTPYLGAEARFTAGPGGYRGALTAWDVQAASVRWQIKEKFPVWSGAAVTAGDVVFYGTMDGFLKAVNALSGEVLWQFKTESGIVGQPTTYRGPDGRQYVAILSGVGGWAGRLVSGDLDARDATAAFGFANAMGDLKDVTKAGGTLYVFRLP